MWTLYYGIETIKVSTLNNLKYKYNNNNFNEMSVGSESEQTVRYKTSFHSNFRLLYFVQLL